MAGLISELKRRNVFRVAVMYIVTAWVIIQVSDAAVPALQLPEWVHSLVFLLLALGFPLALILAWAFELTPEGIKRAEDVSLEESITRLTGRKFDFIIISVLAVAVSILLYERFTTAPEEDTTEVVAETSKTIVVSDDMVQSIAVLPFVDMSAEKDQEYFADGIAEELLSVLSKIKGLRVAARTSTFKFKNSNADIAEIAQALNVTTVLEGSIRKAGDRVRITAQLINASDGFHLWSESYDRTLVDIFAVQDEISQSIVTALKLELNIEERGAAEKTDSVAAYDYYLRGRQYAREPNREDLLTAINFFEQALSEDPNFALAYSGIADAYTWMQEYGGMPAEEAFAKSRTAAEKAIELAPNLAEAWVSLGFIDSYEGRRDEAIEKYEKAIELKPNYALVYFLLGGQVRNRLDFVQAEKLFKQGLELEPNSSIGMDFLANMYGQMGRSNDQMKYVRRMIRDDPDDAYAYEILASLMARTGHFAEAIMTRQLVHRLRPGDAHPSWMAANFLMQLEDFEQAETWIEASAAQGTGNRYEQIARTFYYFNRGEWSTLKEYADQIPDIGSNQITRTFALGDAEAQLGNFAAAEKVFRAALDDINFDPAVPTSTGLMRN
ncbi:MAG: tetratricopeptide repeat protein, partial [Gammaproteobacteria bacterium]